MLSHNPEIIIGTPGRIWYFMENYKLGPSNLKNLRFIVWDEADKLVQNSPKFLSIDHTGSLSGNEIDRGMSGFLDGRSKKHGYFYKKKVIRRASIPGPLLLRHAPSPDQFSADAAAPHLDAPTGETWKPRDRGNGRFFFCFFFCFSILPANRGNGETGVAAAQPVDPQRALRGDAREGGVSVRVQPSIPRPHAGLLQLHQSFFLPLSPF